MEVHTHTHHGKKKWTEYLWEFLMLFLAVFCGFLAENFREHRVERVREKEYIISLVKDLEYDTLQYGKTINRLTAKLPYYDSVLLILKNPSNYNFTLPYRIYMITASERFYTPSKQTIEQLKNSGNLRLIHTKACLDSILNYDSRINGPYKNQTEYAVEYNKRMQAGLEKIFNFSGLNTMLNDLNDGLLSQTKSAYDLKMFTTNKELIQEVYNNHVSTKGAETFYIKFIESAKVAASRLIGFLEKEYHLN